MTTPQDDRLRLIEVPADTVAEAIRRNLWHQGLDVRSVGFYGDNGELLDLGRIYVRAYERHSKKAHEPEKRQLHIGRWLLWGAAVILIGNVLYAVLKSSL